MPAISGPKPDRKDPIVENIPKEIQDIRQWIVWGYRKNKKDAWSKPPIHPHKFMPSDTSFKMSFEEVMTLYFQFPTKIDGIGFVPTPDDPYIGLDLDKCLDGEKITQFAKNVVKASHTYWERSPSETGLRGLIKGELNCPGGKASVGTFEAFESVNYVTITGDRKSLAEGIHTDPEFLRCVNSGFIGHESQENALIQALFHLDPDSHYSDWLKILMALHSAGDYLWLATLWSSCGDSFGGADEVENKWDSFSNERGRKLSVKHIFKLAKAAGWEAFAFDEEKPLLANFEKVGNKTQSLNLEPIYDQFISYADPMFNESGSLVYNRSGKPQYISNVDEFESYLYSKFRPSWMSKGVSKRVLFTCLKRDLPKIDAVETAPHYPEIRGCEYFHSGGHLGDGAYLEEWLDQFSLPTIADRMLTKACLMTTFWGGPAGQRPLFVVRSAAQQRWGSGKTTLAEQIAAVATRGESGSHVAISKPGDIERIAAQIVEPRQSSIRVALLDNTSGAQLSSQAMAALVTMGEIVGKRMYVGKASCPNYFTWIATMNHGKLDEDVASRAVVIELDRPDYSKRLQKINYDAMWADVAAFFRQAPKTLTLFSRHPIWDQEIVGRLEDPRMVMEEVLERCQMIDVDVDTGAAWESMFLKLLEGDGKKDKENVFIPSRTILNAAQEWSLVRSDCTLHQLGPILEKVSARIDRLVQDKLGPTRGWTWKKVPHQKRIPYGDIG